MTIGEALGVAAARLRLVGIDDASREARLLLCRSAGLTAESVIFYPERSLDRTQHAAYEAALDRRCRREPVSRIFGSREFWSLDFRLGPATLDPRPDSETLVEAALAHLPDRTVRVLDLGTGTGCLLLSVLGERKEAIGIGLDRAASAVAMAEGNALRLGLADRARFVVGDWTSCIGARFDMVLANPPYIAAAEITTLAPEVRLHDPREALDGGPDGLDAYRALAADMARILTPEGIAVVELGAGQAADVALLFESGCIETVEVRRDLGGIERVFIGRIRRSQK